jgi:putative nucleotidyltransferase with HDIG domain
MAPVVSQNSSERKDFTTSALERILGDLRRLPLLPATAQQAMAMVQNPNTNLKQLSMLLERDVTLAASILKLANSPLYNWGPSVESLHAAVIRLGARECQSLILAIAMRNVFNEIDPATKTLCAVLWHHCFLTACLCRRLNRELRLDLQGEEFTCGLLHDLGRILLAVTLPREFPVADPMDFVEGSDTLDRECQVLETDHCQVGTEYARQNGLPNMAIAAIRFHHQVEQAPEHRTVLALVAMADHMANFIQRGLEPKAYDLSHNTGFALLTGAWSSEKRDGFARTVPALMADTTSTAKNQANPQKSRVSGELPRPPATPPPSPSADKSVWGSVKSVFRW